MTLTPFDLLLLLGSAQGLFISILLFKKQTPNRTAANYLLGIVSLTSILLLARLVFKIEWVQQFTSIFLLPDAILFIFGPFIWLFVRQLLRMPALSRSQWYLHLLPSFLHLIVLTIIAQHLNRSWHFLNRDQIILIFYLIEGTAIISLLSYTLVSLRLVQNYQKQQPQQTIAPVVSQFLSPFFRIGLLITTSWAIAFIVKMILQHAIGEIYDVFWFLLVTYIYWLAYTVMLRPELFELPPPQKTLNSSDEVIAQKVQDFMSTQKPYLASSLKIGDLAQMLDLPRHDLSRIINQGFGQSFFDFINAYRIDAFVALYNDHQEAEKSILQLAYQVGFNSKSAFNRAFRKIKDSSPSDYFKEQLQDHTIES